MKKNIIIAFVFLFIYMISNGQNKYILYPFYQTYESDGQTYTYPDYVCWSNVAQWNVYPGNTINPGDTVIIESYTRCIMDSIINFLPGSVLILNADADLFPDNINPNSGTSQNTVSLSNFSKIINHGWIYPPKLNINDSLLNYGIITCDLEITQNGVVINNPSVYPNYFLDMYTFSASNPWTGTAQILSSKIINNGTFINYSSTRLGELENNNKLINYNEFYSEYLYNMLFTNQNEAIPGGELINNKHMNVLSLDNSNAWNISFNFINNDLLMASNLFTCENFKNNDTIIVGGGYYSGQNITFSRNNYEDTFFIENTYILDNGLLNNSYGKITISGNLILKNGSVLENHAYSDTAFIYTSPFSGYFNLDYGNMINNGTITLLEGGGNIYNYGKFINNGVINSSTSSWNEINNMGQFYNKGFMNCFTLYNGGSQYTNNSNLFVNDSVGLMNINMYILNSYGEGGDKPTTFENRGTINNYSYIFEQIRNPPLSNYKFNNNGVINNYSTINPAAMNNYGLINNYAQINFDENQASYFNDFKLNNYGILNNLGGILGSGYLFNIDGGTLINNNALISPGGESSSNNVLTIRSTQTDNLDEPPSPYGCLNFSGFRGHTKYEIDISDTTQCLGHDFISISDTLFANGKLDVSITYQPNPNDIITIIHADTVINTFDTVNIPDGWAVLYNQPNKGDVSVRYGNTCNNLNSDFLQDSVSVCGSSYSLRVPNTFESYLWSNGLQDSIITVNAPGWLFCSVGMGTCTLRDSIFVRLVNANINQNDTSLCRGASLTLNTNSSNNILWSNNTTGSSTTVIPSVNTTYYCNATDGLLTCRDSIKININTTLPSTPGVISGATDICPLLGNNTVSSVTNYTIRKISNANSYLWTLPAGVTLVSGQGDTAINLTFSNSFVSGVISVKSVNACGVGTGSRIIAVYKRIASTPGIMYQSFNPVAAAITSVCGRSSETYKIRKVAYATSYTWSLTNGSFATIGHTNAGGINDTAITVNFQSGFTKDTLVVKSITACSVSASRAIVLNALAVPAAVSSIVSSTGNTIPCIGDVVNYTASTLAPTASQTSVAVYRWSKPNNTTIISANLDSSIITLRFNTGFTGGSITAKGQSACGVYGSSKTMILQYLPPTPTSIVSGTGNYNTCIGDVVSYSVTVPTPSTTQRVAIVYRWTKPFYTTIVSANVDSSIINLQYISGYRGGTLSVKGQTACGALGTAKSQALTNSSCPTITSPSLFSKPEIKTDSDFEVCVYPNPSRGDFNLRILEYGNGNYVISIRDFEGRLIKKISTANKIMQCGTDLRPGVYMVEIISGAKRKQIKVVKH